MADMTKMSGKEEEEVTRRGRERAIQIDTPQSGTKSIVGQ